ncbi:MAG: site-specific DNA-methyltransferase, partial [Phototrophicales bacterium]
NRTIILTDNDYAIYRQHLIHINNPVPLETIINTTIHGDTLAMLPFLPPACVDLLILDPPYNLNRTFGTQTFKQVSDDDYRIWVEGWFIPLLRMLKPTTTIYFCGDWRSSAVIYQVLSAHTTVRNRITWEREKGRGAQKN